MIDNVQINDPQESVVLTEVVADHVIITEQSADNVVLSELSADSVVISEAADSVVLTEQAADKVTITETVSETVVIREPSAGNGSFAEIDPVFTNHPANTITAQLIQNWNNAFGWGNHAGLYPRLDGAYQDPLWIISLAWSKITGAPAFITAQALVDYYTKSETDGRYLLLTGGTVTGTTYVRVGTPGVMSFPYESFMTERAGDVKIGVYNSLLTPGIGSGASLTLGYSRFRLDSGNHPAFEFQHMSGATAATNYVRYNFWERNDAGTVVASNIDLLVIKGDGKIRFGAYTTPGFIKTDNQGNLITDTNTYALSTHNHDTQYIQNQFTSGQNADLWVSGYVKVGSVNTFIQHRTPDAGVGLTYSIWNDYTTGQQLYMGINTGYGTVYNNKSFIQSNREFVFLGSSGNVLMGVGGTYTLDVRSSTDKTLILNGTGGSQVKFAADGVERWGNAVGAVTGATNRDYMVYNNQTGTYALLINGDTNNVGIGTLNPQYKLDVAGSGRFSGALAVQPNSASYDDPKGYITLSRAGASNFYISNAGGVGYLDIYHSANPVIQFRTSSDNATFTPRLDIRGTDGSISYGGSWNGLYETWAKHRFMQGVSIDVVGQAPDTADKVVVWDNYTLKYMTKAQLGIGATISQPANQIVYGTGSGVISSSNLTYDGTQLNVNSGFITLRPTTGGKTFGIGSYASDSSFRISDTNNFLLTIDSTGKLLVGYTASQGNYIGQFNGSIYGNSTDAIPLYLTGGGTSGTSVIRIGNNTGSVDVGRIGTDMVFQINGSAVGRFDSTGKLLVGYTASQGNYALQVNGDAYTNGAITTAQPSVLGAAPWKLGNKVNSGTQKLDTTGFVEVSIGGTTYRLALAMDV